MNKQSIGQKGFSIVQVMVAAALAAGLSLVVLKLGSNQSKIQATANASNDVTSFQSIISKYLAKSAVCNQNIQGLSLNLNSNDEDNKMVNLNEFVAEDGRVLYDTSSNNNIGSTFKINNIKVTRKTIDKVIFKFELQKQGGAKRSYGAQTLTKNFEVLATFSSNTVASCFADFEAAATAACESQNGEIINGQCMNGTQCEFETQMVTNFGGETLSCSPSVTNRILYNAKNNATTCAAAGGSVRSYNGDYFCRVTGSTCPDGFTKYQNLTSTTGMTYTARRSCTVDRCSQSCSTGSHSWSNTALENCSTTTRCCLGSNSNGGNAIISAVGCY